MSVFIVETAEKKLHLTSVHTYYLPPAAVSVEITSLLTRTGCNKEGHRYPRLKGRVQQRNRGSKGDDFPGK